MNEDVRREEERDGEEKRESKKGERVKFCKDISNVNFTFHDKRCDSFAMLSKRRGKRDSQQTKERERVRDIKEKRKREIVK